MFRAAVVGVDKVGMFGEPGLHNLFSFIASEFHEKLLHDRLSDFEFIDSAFRLLS